MKKALPLLLIFLFLSCSESKSGVTKTFDNAQEITNDLGDNLTKMDSLKEHNELVQITDTGKEWLENLFKCRHGNKYCFYLDQEEKICTERFYKFMMDSERIYGATNLSEEEIPTAEKKYKEKWQKIYPLRKDMEPWLFGRGQDDMENIRDIKVEKIADLKYRVFVDYDEDYKTISEITLVPNNGSFLIDYSDTEFLK